MKTKTKLYALAGIGFGLSAMASGAAIGSAQIGQCAPAAPGGASGVVITASSFTWDPATLGGTGGCFITGTPTAITSTQPEIISGLTGNLLDLTAGGGAVDDFITFNGTNLNFVLTAFAATATNSTACDTTIGDSCIPAAGSPIELTNTAGGVDISFTMLGTIVDGGVSGTWSALFTGEANLAGTRQTAAAVQTAFLSGGSISTTYSAAIEVMSPSRTTTPEPGTVATFLLGGIGLIGLGRRRLFSSRL